MEGHVPGDGYAFSGVSYNLTPGHSISSDLTLEQDAARVIMGEPWRMPSIDEVQELIYNCTAFYGARYGVDGVKLVSNINGQSIFIPAGGYMQGQQLVAEGTKAYLWSKSYNTGQSGKCLLVNVGTDVVVSFFVRSRGCNVRPVIDS